MDCRDAVAERVRTPMAKLLKKKSGFTLIELMIVVAIIGILAALAIPAFLGYVRRSKSTEVTTQLDNLFKSMASYYDQENATSQAVSAASATNCTIAPVAVADSLPDNNPNDVKRAFPPPTPGTSWEQVKGAIAGFVYYSYYFDARAVGCSVSASVDTIYTFWGYGDLDADTTDSSFSLAAGSDASNSLYRARSFNILNELE